jgi:hypothetical protein
MAQVARGSVPEASRRALLGLDALWRGRQKRIRHWALHAHPSRVITINQKRRLFGPSPTLVNPRAFAFSAYLAK